MKVYFSLQKYLFYIKSIVAQGTVNFDIPTLCCNFPAIIASRSLFKSKTKKKQDVSKNMPYHFLIIVIVTAIRLIYKEFFKNTK